MRRVCLIEGIGGVRYEDSVFLLQAATWDAAREKAMAIGEAGEEVHTNSEGERVRWAFERLVTLDELEMVTDGAEVYSVATEFTGPPIPFDHEFTPEDSDPTQSV